MECSYANKVKAIVADTYLAYTSDIDGAEAFRRFVSRAKPLFDVRVLEGSVKPRALSFFFSHSRTACCISHARRVPNAGLPPFGRTYSTRS